MNNTANCHVVAFCLHHNFEYGEIPSGIVIRHKCNNPQCINPKHLLLGTHKDNSADMVLAGNSLRGEKNPKSRITQEIVLEIRKLWLTTELKLREIASMFNISSSHVGLIVSNFIWKDQNYLPPNRKSAHGRGIKYSKEEVLLVKELRRQNTPIRKISELTGISQSHVSNLINNKQRKEIAYDSIL